MNFLDDDGNSNRFWKGKDRRRRDSFDLDEDRRKRRDSDEDRRKRRDSVATFALAGILTPPRIAERRL